jgi:hypothetical protein
LKIASGLGDWRVEWVDDDGGIEVAVFSGRMRASGRFAAPIGNTGNFQEVSLAPYSDP